MPYRTFHPNLDEQGRRKTDGLYQPPSAEDRSRLFATYDRLSPRAQTALLRLARMLAVEEGVASPKYAELELDC